MSFTNNTLKASKQRHRDGRKRIRSDDSDFEWHRNEDNWSQAEYNDFQSNSSTTSNCSNSKKKSKQSLEYDKVNIYENLRNQENDSASEDDKEQENARSDLEKHRKIVINNNSAEGSPVLHKPRAAPRKFNHSFPEYKTSSSTSRETPMPSSTIPSYVTPRRHITYRNAPTRNCSSVAYNQRIFGPSYNNYQLLGDSQLLRFSEQILHLRSKVYHGEDTKKRYLGYCVSGQKIKDLEDLIKYEPKLYNNVLMLIGTNDFLQNNDLDSMCSSYTAIVDHLKHYSDNIVLLTVPPIPKLGWQGPYWCKFRKFNEFIMQLADNSKISVIDSATAFIGYDNLPLEQYFELYYENSNNRQNSNNRDNSNNRENHNNRESSNNRENSNNRRDFIHLNFKGFTILKTLLDIHFELI